MKDLNDIQNVFIHSSGRSGSTLLSNILNAHSSILSLPESVFLIVLSKMYSRKTKFVEQDYKDIVNRIWLRKTEYKALWNINESTLLNTLIENSPQSLNEILQHIYLSYNGSGAKNSPSIIIDKNPFYFNFLDELNSCFPKAKHILLVRDYRDRMVSLRKSKFSNQVAGNLIKGLSWNKRNKAIYKMSQLPNTFLVKYEELVASPAKIITEICQFLELEFEKSMLDFHSSNPHNYTNINASEEMKVYIEDLHHRSNTKINTKRIGIWKNDLPQSTVSILETYCGKTGEQFDYRTSLNNSWFRNFRNRLKMTPGIIKGSFMLFLKKKSFSLPYWLQKKLVKAIKKTK